MGRLIYGVEGRWLWVPGPYVSAHTVAQFATGSTAGPGGIYPLVMQLRDDAGDKVFPRYKTEKIGGLYSTGESNDIRDGRVGAAGEIPRTSYRRGKTVTFEGIAQGTTLVNLHDMTQALTTAFDDQTLEGLMICLPPGPDVSGNYSYFMAKPLAVEIDDELAFSPMRMFTGGHERRYVVALRSARAGGVFYRDQAGTTYA